MIRKIDLIPSSIKLLIALIYDLFSLSFAFFLAYLIRLGTNHQHFTIAEFSVLINVSLSTMLIFYFTGTYRIVIRHFNASSTLKIIGLLFIASLIFYFSGKFYDAFVPRTVPIIFFTLAAIFIAGARAVFAVVTGEHWFDEKEGVIIYGASSTGRQLANALSSANQYQVLAYIDEKSQYTGRNVLGLSIYHPNYLPKLIERFGQFKVLIALSNVSTARMKEVVSYIEPYALEVLTIPSMGDIVSGKQKIDQLKEVTIEQLLGRDPVEPIAELLSANITNKSVLVSGAGGSIGAELCRQISLQNPVKLVLLDVSEAHLYTIEQELQKQLSQINSSIELIALIGNVQDASLMHSILEQHQVTTIYHAAAYKHVPIVENNIVAGIANNVNGTYVIANAAISCKVETFVLISTDKAVRPTNVMGASKRLAELTLQGMAKRTDHNTRFVMVRFGNVLGSSGSVVPLFKEQIRTGGPITITHPEIVRYFMSIPEAAQLVIQAGAMGTGGDVFVLDMGEPVKIVDLAYKMTHLMGLTIKDESLPDGDIALAYTGLRPGEKLYEELLIDDGAQSTQHPRILSAKERALSWPLIQVLLSNINEAIDNEDVMTLQKILLSAPIDYQPTIEGVALQ